MTCFKTLRISYNFINQYKRNQEILLNDHLLQLKLRNSIEEYYIEGRSGTENVHLQSFEINAKEPIIISELVPQKEEIIDIKETIVDSRELDMKPCEKFSKEDEVIEQNKKLKIIFVKSEQKDEMNPINAVDVISNRLVIIPSENNSLMKPISIPFRIPGKNCPSVDLTLDENTDQKISSNPIHDPPVEEILNQKISATPVCDPPHKQETTDWKINRISVQNSAEGKITEREREFDKKKCVGHLKNVKPPKVVMVKTIRKVGNKEETKRIKVVMLKRTTTKKVKPKKVITYKDWDEVAVKVRQNLDYRCPKCPEITFYERPDYFFNHILSDHKNELFDCNKCSETNLDGYTFIRHFKRKHEYQCLCCGKKFKMKAFLITHIKRLTMEPCPYPDCKAKFPSHVKREDHLKWHTGEMRSVCDICGHVSSSYDTSKYHMMTHKGKRHLCTKCGQTFMLTSHLKAHLLRHAGLLYKCNLCSKSYTAQSNLRKHKRRYHDGEV